MKPSKVVTAFSVAMVVACAKEPPKPVLRPAIDQKKFEALYRAGKTVQGSLAVGLNFQKFGELQQNLATEVSIGSDKASSEKEKALVKAYNDILLTLHESSALWSKQISDAGNDLVTKGDIIVEGHDVPAIVAKYGFAKTPHTQTYEIIHKSIHWETVSGDSIQKVWETAGEQLNKANKLYYAEEQVIPKA